MGEQKEYLVTQTNTWVNRINTWSHRQTQGCTEGILGHTDRHIGEQDEYLVTQTDTWVDRRSSWSHRQGDRMSRISG
ncbi:hypothetical protein DPMN_157693 [Dreissena polymorpha]|uniref:Uncharacterized protein n=1 Tax=Dreissena polymorpha TaxID=45954 RepID=A0A9D4IMI0_DREPO|nr:hypothetical protein DPMN_157693 [Dreissena polymorpha]